MKVYTLTRLEMSGVDNMDALDAKVFASATGARNAMTEDYRRRVHHSDAEHVLDSDEAWIADSDGCLVQWQIGETEVKP